MSLGPAEIAIIVLVILLLFGGKKLPELARSLGRSMRIMKSEVKEMQNDETDNSAAPQQQAIEQPQQQYQQPQQGQYGNPAQNNQ
ncbi:MULTISPECIES: Sec-independent protein translocase subunit TatA [Corynebacterium]|uniref:Sec-independent protein translocase protein TatA n=2 Tax=Corynebacterium glucuronolyticum TaxID=39791 RepID=A0A7T4EE80_9CORY|nr:MULTISPECIES: Sec-independent protein translocase subunit TatA [Corynebacterium]EEI26439.1 twin arginine-targeting protein translocase, TatA/E family [Corynebacterium glucuronolyticum ATCC 51867]EEI63086.1 twin arginine-targeting protein translocase, TatA/E family [Corynebacterium glucuronolyticum ATCC 51866]MCT1442732.1 Sec-independent protein translocase subunit TatA [Corynebacterium glucuronolyticum]MCT1562680.1 Sec-independent protein translocase subunit TatA [Corynebacterium glucuronoly